MGSNLLDGDELLTPSQLAEYLSISKRTIRRMVLSGRLPQPIKYSKRIIRWKRSEIKKHMGIVK